MSMKIRISYERPGELQAVIDRLGDMVKRQSKPSKTGKYSRVYLTVEKSEKA